MKALTTFLILTVTVADPVTDDLPDNFTDTDLPGTTNNNTEEWKTNFTEKTSWLFEIKSLLLRHVESGPVATGLIPVFSYGVCEEQG